MSNEWYSKSTKEVELDKAIVTVIELRTIYKTKINNNVPIHSFRKTKKHLFNTIADLAITRIENGTKHKRLVRSIKSYLKPFFGEISIREIDAAKLTEFDLWRTKKMKRVAAKDTVKEHNAGLQLIFNEAILLDYVKQLELPELVNNGRSGERRAAFTKEEYNTILDACKKWIKEVPQKKSQLVRHYLYCYIQSERNRAIFHLSFLGGLRACEISALKLSDVIDQDFKVKTQIVLQADMTKGSERNRVIVG